MLKDIRYWSKSKENKQPLFILFAFFAQALLSCSVLATDSVSVGVVNVTYLMENAPQSVIASVKLKSKFSPQEKKLAADLDEINTLELALNEIKVAKKGVGLQRQKESQLRSRKRLRSRSLQDFREELRFARDVALDEVQKEVFKAIDQVRIQEKIDIIIQDYISASKKVDITPAVLAYLRNKADKSEVSGAVKSPTQ